MVASTPKTGLAQLRVGEMLDLVLKQNPTIQELKAGIDLAEGSRLVAQSAFNTVYSAQVSRYKAQAPQTFVEPKITGISSGFDYSVEASKKLSFGTVITPMLGVNATDHPQSFTGFGIAKVGRGFGLLQLSQPLLAGWGTKYTRAELRAAVFQLSATEYEFYHEVSKIILESLRSYLNYLEAYQLMQIQGITESTLKKSVSEVEHMIELDALPGSEILVLKANLANQTAARLNAENQFIQSRNLLAGFMGITESDAQNLEVPDTLLHPQTEGGHATADYLSQWLGKSLMTRNDYLSVQKSREASGLEVFVSRKDLLPRLNLNLATGFNGIAGGKSMPYYQGLYENIPGVNYQVGLSFVFNGKNQRYKGNLIQSMAGLEIQNQRAVNTEILIRNEVRNAWNDFQFATKILGFQKESAEHYEKAFSNEIRKFQTGNSTTFNVVQIQHNFLESKTKLISSRIDQTEAVLNFRYCTGTLLEIMPGRNISIDPVLIFSMPEKN